MHEYPNFKADTAVILTKVSKKEPDRVDIANTGFKVNHIGTFRGKLRTTFTIGQQVELYEITDMQNPKFKINEVNSTPIKKIITEEPDEITFETESGSLYKIRLFMNDTLQY